MKAKAHREDIQAVRAQMQFDKELAEANVSDLCSAVFDMQKILVSPTCNNSICFYRGGYHSLNFSIFDEGLKVGHNYFWEETEGGKGSNEIISNLHNFMLIKLRSSVKEFRFYADNCGGQNKNRIVFSFFSWFCLHYQVSSSTKLILTKS